METFAFRISCALLSCLSRRMEAIEKLVAKREFDNPKDKKRSEKEGKELF